MLLCAHLSWFDQLTLKCWDVVLYTRASISALQIWDVAFYYSVPQFVCLSALSVHIGFFILPSWQCVAYFLLTADVQFGRRGWYIIGLGVSFLGFLFLDFIEYNFLIVQLEIGEFSPVGKRATGINEASKTSASVCYPPILPLYLLNYTDKTTVCHINLPRCCCANAVGKPELTSWI